MNLSKSVCVIIFFVCASQAQDPVNKKDVVSFPESEEDKEIKNKDNRKPVYLPSVCPINELYYPGDQKDDWICDCRPSFLYHPGSDMCWPAYQRGPCPVEHYLVLPSDQDTSVPTCVKNPCRIDGYVPWGETCEKLGSSQVCNNMLPMPAVVGINATTLAIGCVKLSVDSRFGEIVKESCPPGCKRNIAGKCVPMPS